jgi:stage II sporulation protein D
MASRSKRDFWAVSLLRGKMARRTITAAGPRAEPGATARRVAAVLVAAATVATTLAFTARAESARWVIKGHGFGHGAGMSQYGAYGLARHGRGYRSILDHYYRHTHLGRAGGKPVRVLLDSGPDGVKFRQATKACGKRLRRQRAYKFRRTGRKVTLRRGGHRLARCGRSATATGRGTIRIRGQGSYRGRLKVKAFGGGLLIINAVGIDAYVKGVVANEMPASWAQAALRSQAVAARSYALATKVGGSFDVYDDTRSQVYGGKASETASTNRACRRTKRRVVRYGRRIATTYYSSSSGGRTESIQFAFPGATPVPYLKSVKDPYDRISPDHTWRVRYGQRQMQSRLAGLFSGRLRRIKVLKRGVSPRIVRARIVGSRGSSKVSGPTLQFQLGLKSSWARFRKR